MRGRSWSAMPVPVSATSITTSLALAPRADVDAAAGGRVLDRVVEQVGDDLAQAIAIGGDDEAALQVL